jgi:hypothetical protein
MKTEHVPQDQSKTYAGHQKVIYAVNKQGHYEKVESSGWEPEELVTLAAVEDLNELTKLSRINVEQGVSSTLEYFMYSRRFDITGLAQASGFFEWQVKRHLKPEIFKKLSVKKKLKYSDALGVSIENLSHLPKEDLFL